MIAAILLAAGASRRMGRRNKLLLPWGGGTLIEHAVATVRASRVGQIVAVLGYEAEMVHGFVENQGVRIVLNDHWSTGLTGSIQAGLRAARGNASGYLVCFCDLPLLCPADLDTIIADFERATAADERCIAVPAYQGRRGHPVLFASSYRDAILAHEDRDGCHGIMTTNARHVRETAMPDDRALRDLDTPQAYWDLLAAQGSRRR